VDSFPEHPASSVVTDAAKTARPKSLRLRTAGASLLFPFPSVPHVPQDVGLQLPQALAGLPSTLNNLSIAISPSKKLLTILNAVQNLVVRPGLRSERISSSPCLTDGRATKERNSILVDQ
jgi:hypothetical protein